MTMVNTSIDNGSLVIESEKEDFEDGVINFSGADILAKGTILARNTSNGKFQVYAKGGNTNGNGVPVGVLTYELEATGAGDKPVRPLMRGKFNQDRLVIDADGDASNIDASVRDLLRSKGLIPLDIKQLARLDNPQGSEVDS